VNLTPEASILIVQTLKVFRATANPKQFQVVGESAPAKIQPGPNSFSTRVPISAGDQLGLAGTGGTVGALYCPTGSAADRIGAMAGNPPTGSTGTVIAEGAGLGIPVTAVIEPDVDGDGYGDETQDKCPQSAALQTECPIVTVEASAAAKRGSAAVLVTTNHTAPVKVTGAVKLGKGKKVKLSGGTQTVSPGKLGRFTLKFSKKLKTALGELSPKQSLKLKVTATATDLIGRLSSDKLPVKLKGEG
jgi:hypothetical protein